MNNMNMRNYRFSLLLLFAAIVLIFIAHNCCRIIVLTSPSTQYKYCLHLLNAKPKKGDLCVFERNGLTIVKYLVGIEGDRITNEKNNIYVNAYYIGTAQKTGQLTPIKDQIISKGYLFVSGTHRYSFDSRYEEFGLIKVSDLKGRAIGLGKWDIRK